jgi:hypothetical protein
MCSNLILLYLTCKGHHGICPLLRGQIGLYGLIFQAQLPGLRHVAVGRVKLVVAVAVTEVTGRNARTKQRRLCADIYKRKNYNFRSIKW